MGLHGGREDGVAVEEKVVDLILSKTGGGPKLEDELVMGSD